MFHRRRHLRRSCILCVVLSLLIFTIYSAFFSTFSFAPNLSNSTQSPVFASARTVSSQSTLRNGSIPDIFELSLWRLILTGGKGNQTLCETPSQYRSIVNAYCRAHNRENCSMIPCTLIYLTDEFTTNIECLRGGKFATGIQPDWVCRKSPALELFSNSNRKPSICAEAYTTLTAELYGQALAPYRDEETSKWGLTLEGESIGYYPSVASKKRVLSLFDISLGYDRRFFDLITDKHLTDYVNKITNKHNQRLTINQILRKKVKERAPILWINSNCDTPSNRTAYMLELMRYISVDVRGKCGNPSWNQSSTLSDPKYFAIEKTTLASEYLFTIAIENSLEYDYVTEKLWQPLAAGSVPLYLGAPNIDEWLPCYDYSCIINLRNFTSVEDVANLIRSLTRNRTRYIEYHQWRREKHVRPSFITMTDYFQEANKHSIECLICDMVHRNDHGTTRRKLLAANNPFNDTFPSLS
ncbi:unnamed protein product [Rotaria socialis]|uniref:Fucosyltransferase n=1 Tax=Rotaria socialis TaxID=392032 RepID=A0A819VF73_9BILA|nr:unnamed protein product [Rotaria socialis]CAF3404323.1 unnamed protein product [Rotaria socialis]CAF3631808.1 unnamed protein product [Rotaria socialis]CAF3652620.1 unnamed protein product [Rotaria socialis]CAF4107900.1 unnamed protein product [Rotaria socialis]